MRRIALVFLALVPGAVQAETVTIRSGEHAAYSRLVLNLPEGADWSIAPTAQGFRAEFGDPVSAIDTSGVFDRIPRDRLAGLEASDRLLDLLVNCDCHLDAFLYRPDMLVIDIIDGSAPEGSATAISRAAEGLPEAGEDEAAETETALSNRADLASQGQMLEPVQLPLFTNSGMWDDAMLALPPSFTTAAPRDPNLVEAERAILESFARAATQGVFDFPARPLPPPLEEGQEASPGRIAPMSDPMDGVPIPLTAADPAGPGFLLRTGIDRDAFDAANGEGGPDSCPEGINHDITTWGMPGAYNTLIPELRLAAADEIGTPDRDAVLSLARAYIYYGFGLEARRALGLLGPEDEQIGFLNAIAHLVDGEPVAVSRLLPFRACDNSMEAWIVLAAGRFDTSDQRIKSAVLISVRALPDALRGHLGVRFAQIFAEAGDLHSAQEILSGAVVAVTGDGREAEIAAADLAGRTDGLEAEVAHLDAFIERSPRAEPADMVRLLDLARETDAEVDEDILELAETMRFESNGTETTADLVEAEVLFQLDLGDYRTAFDLLNGDIGPMGEERLNSLRSAAMIVLTEQAPDGAFLGFAFSDEIDGANHVAEHAIAERLLDLGFAEQAFVMIGAPITGDLREERLALQARAASVLAEMGQEAPEDESQALAEPETAPQSEDIGEASLAETDETSPLAAAWRRGAWDELEQSDDPLLSSASRALLTPTVPPSEETPLTDSRALLDQAREAREIADGLLNRFTVEGAETSP